MKKHKIYIFCVYDISECMQKTKLSLSVPKINQQCGCIFTRILDKLPLQINHCLNEIFFE